MPRTDKRGSFGADLVAAVRVWRRHPLLPVLSLVVWAVPTLLPAEPPWEVVAAVLFLLLVGYPGTERIWYQRAFAGAAVSPGDIWQSVLRFFWPFLRMAILVGFLLVLLSVPLQLTHPEDGATWLVILTAFFVLLDVALTFVVPALSFSTRKVREAGRIGLSMIREEWPRSVWYALTPAFALLVIARMPRLSEGIGSLERFALTEAATLLSLAFKGAIARFYLLHAGDARPSRMGES